MLGSAVPLVASLAAVAAAAVVDVVAAIVSALALADVGAVSPAPAVVEAAAAAAVGGDTVGDICAEEEGDEWLLSTTETGDKTDRGEGVRRARAPAAADVAAPSKAGDGGRPEREGDSVAWLSLCALGTTL